ncbi:hypothetical protein [Vibrio algarum]|uniref:Thrombospondin n=1 Tax=Vibrio algarum TaxID=3020714 RepID=A0ABT4YQM9_9VIBR|nr:hypothetical protein [Vibrio sp. KJ40-1]MDB1123388.1 hypothetical protein [Vibrio sp. KJ40-1]
MKLNRLSIALGLIGTSALMGCGDSDSASTTTPPSTATPAAITTYDVTAIDGYLQNANVWLDLNSNYLLDENEPFVRSGEGGVAKLDVSDIENYEDYPVVVQAIAGETIDIGTDVDAPENNLVNTSYMMSAPAGETDVTPLSTLVHVILEQQIENATSGQGSDGLTPEELDALKEKAKSEVADQLGIDKEDVLGDFIDEGNGDVAFAAENIVNSKILPEKPEELAAVVEEAKQDDPDDHSNDSSFLAKTTAATSQIKSTIEEVQKNTANGEEPNFEEEQVFDGSQDATTDTDNDSVPDFIDAFPNDPSEWVDTDRDGRDANGDLINPAGEDEGSGYGDNSDLDDDGDGVNDTVDAFPLNKHESSDNDGDFVGDNADPDDDNDSYLDADDGTNNLVDEYPLDNTRAGDHDNDGIDSLDDLFPTDVTKAGDSDSDGVDRIIDLYPTDATKAGDFDSDGVDSIIDLFPTDVTKAGDIDGDGVDSVDDLFPTDGTKAGDSDGDGVDRIIDQFPDDDTKAGDFDGDNVDFLIDEFRNNPNEWVDADGDGYGDNLADKFPSDATNWSDADGDGYGDETDDAYTDDATKAVMDVTTSSTFTTPYVDDLATSAQIVDASIDITTEQFLDNTVQTTTTIVYNVDAFTYGSVNTVEVVDTQTDTFSRVTHYSFDYNLDGDTQFEGKLLEIGERQTNGETYWRYIDEADGSMEGVNNGDGRAYHATDFSSMSHPIDLSNIDTIHKVTVEYSASGGNVETTTNYDQFDVGGFDYQDNNTQIVNFKHSSVRTVDSNGKLLAYSNQEDWEGDGTNNELLTFTLDSDTTYTFIYERPIWANPTDEIIEEYADYNFNASDLSSYWYKEEARFDFDTGDNIYFGYRYVLDEQAMDSPNVKLVDDTHPDGYLFSEWAASTTDVDEYEHRESATWTNYHLADYDFTASSNSTGQNHIIHLKQDDGIWLSYVFSEWGSQDITLLADKVDALRSGGTDINDITTSNITGLSNISISPNGSFRYDDNNQPIQWYLVTNNSDLTNGDYEKLSVTLTDDGLTNGWLVYNTNNHLFVAKPVDPNNVWNWWDAYSREEVTINDINTNPTEFSWTSSLGQFFLDESLASIRLSELSNQPADCSDLYLEGTSDSPLEYSEFVTTSTACGYSQLDTAMVEGISLYRKRNDYEYRGYIFNSDGTVTYDRSAGDIRTYQWELTDQGIIKITHDDGGIEYITILGSDADSYSILVFETWTDDDGATYSEFYATERSNTEPVIIDPTDTTNIIDLIKDSGTLYSFWEDDGHLYQETFTTSDDNLSLYDVSEVLPSKSLDPLSLDFDQDIVLSDSGWVLPLGYTFNMANDQLNAHPEGVPEASYSMTGLIEALDREYIIDGVAGLEAFDFEDYAYNNDFSDGAKRIELEFTSNDDIYYLWDDTPFVRQVGEGYDDDLDGTASTLNQLFVSAPTSTTIGEIIRDPEQPDPVNNYIDGGPDAITCIAIGETTCVELVNASGIKTAYYYRFVYEEGDMYNTAELLAVGDWDLINHRTEDMITFTITTTISDALEDVNPEDGDEPTLLFSVYDGLVYRGEIQPAGTQDDEPLYLYGQTARDDIYNNIIVEEPSETPVFPTLSDINDLSSFIAEVATYQTALGETLPTFAMRYPNGFVATMPTDETAMTFYFNDDKSLMLYEDDLLEVIGQWVLETESYNGMDYEVLKIKSSDSTTTFDQMVLLQDNTDVISVAYYVTEDSVITGKTLTLHESMNLDITDCSTGNEEWTAPSDATFISVASYYGTAASCIVTGSSNFHSLLPTDGQFDTRVTFAVGSLDDSRINNSFTALDEAMIFRGNGTGEFNDGTRFNWVFSDDAGVTGAIAFTIENDNTAGGIMTITDEHNGSYFAIKAYFNDSTGGEMYDDVFRLH